MVRHESGQLRASWAAPDSGLDPTGYTLHWKESGADWADQNTVSEANAKGTSHIITGLTDGVEYAVRVIAYKDDAESAPSGEVAATPQETVPPSLSSAVVDGATLTVTFDEALDTNGGPDKTAFAVTVAGNDRGVDTVSVSGSIVTITLVTAVFAGDAVTVDYTAPTDQDAARIQDLAGNTAASFSGQAVTNETASDPLTASAHDVPSSHDGSAAFTFELRFSEEFPLSYSTLRDAAFTVTGGHVTNARRLEDGGNVKWEITVQPDSNGTVTVELPVTTDCTAPGAICIGDRRPLSSPLELTVDGPEGEPIVTNSPATGRPAISGTAQVGETLTASTSGIGDADGLTNATFSYQWLAGGSDIAGAAGSTHTLTYSEQGQTIQVRVTFTDDAGNAESLTSAATAQVEAKPNTPATGAPTISGTPQVGETLTASTSGIADQDGLDDVSYSYQWLAGGTDIDGATGSRHTLTASQQGQTVQVRVSFTDDAGNAESRTSVATDAVAAKPVPLTASFGNVPDSHTGSGEFTFNLSFSENFPLSYRTLRDHAFTIDGGDVTRAQRKVPGSNRTWTITVEPAGNGAVSITLPETTDCDDTGAICTSGGRMLSHSASVSISGPS